MRKFFNVKFIIFFLVFLLVISIPFIFFYFNNKNIYLKKARVYMAKKDMDNAEKYYIKYANKGNAEDKIVLANIYRHEFNNFDKYREWYEKAANDGNIEALLEVADMYYYDKNNPKNMEKAITFYEKYTNLNKNTKDVNIQLKLAKIYMNNIYDVQKAIKWYEKAAENNSIEAMLVLGTIFYKGIDKKEIIIVGLLDYTEDYCVHYVEKEDLIDYEYNYKIKKGVDIEPNIDKAILFFEKAFNLLLAKKEFSSEEEKKYYETLLDDVVIITIDIDESLNEIFKDYSIKFCENLYTFYGKDSAELFLFIGFAYKENEKKFNDNFNKAMDWLKNNKKNFVLALMYRYIINTEESLLKARQLFYSCLYDNTNSEEKEYAEIELSRLYKNLDTDEYGESETPYDDVLVKIERLNRRK